MLRILWTIWFGLTALGAGWLMMALTGQQPAAFPSTVFLPGQTTHGHHQIEMKCAICHLPDGGITDQSCIDCHGADLKASRDTHPKSKFTDPNRAVLLERIDAQNCLTCHQEHQEDQTHAMRVTVPNDFCWHCHKDISKDRPSHQDFAFNSCANAGCHNYHDNLALYENFLKKHSGEPTVLIEPRNPLRKLQQHLASKEPPPAAQQLEEASADAPEAWRDEAITVAWSKSPHAQQGVNCSGCHGHANATASDESWNRSPDHQSCAGCHDSEVEGFLAGKHGLRSGVGLEKMSPQLARIPMHAAAAHRELDCSACHDPHQPDLQFAAFDACRSCHDDEHTQSYSESAHFELWQAEREGTAAEGTGVSCATCHMPRNTDGLVQHNQNANLQPNEKMARTVCMNCHGLQFTLDALADPELKANCYSSPPSESVKSLQMARDWFESKKK